MGFINPGSTLLDYDRCNSSSASSVSTKNSSMLSFPLQIYFIVYFHDGKNNILRYIEYKTPSSMNFWHKLWDVHTFPYWEIQFLFFRQLKTISHDVYVSVFTCWDARTVAPVARSVLSSKASKTDTLNCQKKKNADEANMGFHQGKVLIFVAPNQSVWSKDSKKNLTKKPLKIEMILLMDKILHHLGWLKPYK